MPILHGLRNKPWDRAMLGSHVVERTHRPRYLIHMCSGVGPAHTLHWQPRLLLQHLQTPHV